jgi:hypothetical protein
MSWRGRPLATHQVIVYFNDTATTETGLSVHCVLDTDQYPSGSATKRPKSRHSPITRYDFHGEWHYTIHPTETPDPHPH